VQLLYSQVAQVVASILDQLAVPHALMARRGKPLRYFTAI
jgi:hypothetical protein